MGRNKLIYIEIAEVPMCVNQMCMCNKLVRSEHYFYLIRSFVQKNRERTLLLDLFSGCARGRLDFEQEFPWSENY